MKGLLVLAFLVVACFTLGQAVECNFCSFQFFGFCWFSSTRKMTCSTATQRCGVTKAFVAGSIYIFSRLGCYPQQDCEITTETPDRYTAMIYNTTCCPPGVSLCNAGSASARLSLLSGAGILSLWLLALA